MKNLTTALQKGNIRPKDRMILLVQDYVSKDKDKKSILTDADKQALIDNWIPKTSAEADEYNAYQQAWRMASFAEMDAQTTFLEAESLYFRTLALVGQPSRYPVDRAVIEALERLKDIKKVTGKEAIEIMQKQREAWLKYPYDKDMLISNIAFSDKLNDKEQEELKELYADVDIETSFLKEQEELTELHKKKDYQTIADRITKRSYNKYAKEYQLYHYYANIPLEEVANRLIKTNGLNILTLEQAGMETETMDIYKPLQELDLITRTIEKYAEESGTTMEKLLEETVLEWIEDGLFEEYPPLYLAQPDLYNRWIEAKKEATDLVESLIKEGKLKIIQPKSVKDNPKIEKALKEDRVMTGQEAWKIIKEAVADGNIKSQSDKFKGEDEVAIETASLLEYDKNNKLKSLDWLRERLADYEANAGVVDDPENPDKCLDRELLISKDGAFSFFNLNLTEALGYIKAVTPFTEAEENGEKVVRFSNEIVKEAFIKIRATFLEKYSILLAFDVLFEGLSEEFKTDLTYKVKGWLKDIEEYIDQYNKDFNLFRDNPIYKPLPKGLKVKRVLSEGILIDKKAVKPHETRLEEYYKDFRRYFGEDFGKDE